MKIRFGMLLLVCAVVAPRVLWADVCAVDRSKVCGQVSPGKGRVHQCMMSSLSQLTPACQQVVQTSEALRQRFVAVCKNDTRRFCAVEQDLRPENVVDCMRRNKEKYIPECKEIYHQIKSYNYPILQ